MRRISLPFIVLIGMLFSITTVGQAQSKSVKAVKAVLQQQAIDWNKGDLDAFMQGYWQSPDLQFIGSRGVTYGWQKTLDNYKKSYPDQATMGQLTFEIIKVEQLSRKSVMLTGKYTLDRKEKDNLSGYFLLVWKKMKGNWVIIADHTN